MVLMIFDGARANYVAGSAGDGHAMLVDVVRTHRELCSPGVNP
jgi:hypothetical protein